MHAKAQEDFLNFIDTELAEKYQVIYTTHSPFLVPTDSLHRVRTVEDIEDVSVKNSGTKIHPDALHNSKDTIFPLQSALGYDLAQSLFIGKNCLIVEGISDFLYLDLLNSFLKEKDKHCLDNRWKITPVGGADKIATFVSLFKGNNLNMAILIDFKAKDRQKINSYIDKGFLQKENFIMLNEYNNEKDADIEDLLEENFYINLVNACYTLENKISAKKIHSNGRIVKRIEKHFEENKINSDGFFSHLNVARHLMKNFNEHKNNISDETIDKFQQIFERVNTLLKE